MRSATFSLHLPVLLDVKGPLKLQVSYIVVIDEFRDGLVVASGGETGGRCLGLD